MDMIKKMDARGGKAEEEEWRIEKEKGVDKDGKKDRRGGL